MANLNLNDIINEADVKKINNKSETINKRVEQSTGPRIIEDVTEILPMKEEVSGTKAVEQHYNDLMDNAIERVKKELWEEKIKPYQDKCKQLAEEAEFSGLVDPKELHDLATPTSPDGTVQPNLVYDYDLPSIDSANEKKNPTSIVSEQLDDISSINKNDRVDDITNIYRPDVKDPVDHLSNLEDEMMKAQDIELDMADLMILMID